LPLIRLYCGIAVEAALVRDWLGRWGERDGLEEHAALAFIPVPIRVHSVRQDKPGRSSNLKGGCRGSCR